MSTYPSVGNVSRLSCTFTNTSTNQLVDPTTVTVTVQDPDLNQTTTTATRDSVGTYHLDIVLTLAGSWFYRFIATGIVVAQTEDIEIVVAPRRF